MWSVHDVHGAHEMMGNDGYYHNGDVGRSNGETSLAEESASM